MLVAGGRTHGVGPPYGKEARQNQGRHHRSKTATVRIERVIKHPSLRNNGWKYPPGKLNAAVILPEIAGRNKTARGQGREIRPPHP